MKTAFILALLFGSHAYASKTNEVCVLYATRLGADAVIEITCDSRVLKSYRLTGEYKVWRTYKAKEIKWLLNQGYEMKSDEVFVK